MRNLNANPAYKKMRDIRECLRSENKDLCGIKMMDGLYHYSELRHAYIKKVKSHIRRHNLVRFEDYQLNLRKKNKKSLNDWGIGYDYEYEDFYRAMCLVLSNYCFAEETEKFMVYVNLSKQNVVVQKGDKVIRQMICSTGKQSTPTSKGEFKQ